MSYVENNDNFQDAIFNIKNAISPDLLEDTVIRFLEIESLDTNLWRRLHKTSKLAIAFRYIAMEYETVENIEPECLKLSNGYTVYHRDQELYAVNLIGHMFNLDEAVLEFFKSLTDHEVMEIRRLWNCR